MRIIFALILIAIIVVSSISFTTQKDGFEQRDHEKQNKKAIALLMRKPEDLPLWIKHHRELGISKFYIRMEDTPGWDEFLKAQPDVEFELAESDKANNYNTLQTRQLDFVNKTIKKAQQDGIAWLFHIDADELLEGDLATLDTLSPDIKTITMQNVEAVYDGTEKTCFDARRFKRCAEKNICRSYGNGKSAGRIEPGVSLKGPHNFGYNGDHNKNTIRIEFKDLHVLHFDSCSFGAWAEKFQHLSKGSTNKDTTPFPYYEESKKIAASAYETYMKTVGESGEKENDKDIYVRN